MSGLSSWRGTPVSFSTCITHSAGNVFFVHHCKRCCEMPKRLASKVCVPTDLIAFWSASFFMRQAYTRITCNVKQLLFLTYKQNL